MSKPTVGLFVPLKPHKEHATTLASFLKSALPLVQAEPLTVQWYGVKFPDDSCAIFDTFVAEGGRDAHVSGKVAAALLENAPTLLAESPDIKKVDVLAAKLKGAGEPNAGTTVGLYAHLVAKPDKAEILKQFLIDALPLAQEEPETFQWFALRYDATTFGIFDTAPTQSGIDAHLSGQIAAKLMASADELLSTPPDIKQFEILAANVI